MKRKTRIMSRLGHKFCACTKIWFFFFHLDRGQVNRVIETTCVVRCRLFAHPISLNVDVIHKFWISLVRLLSLFPSHSAWSHRIYEIRFSFFWHFLWLSGILFLAVFPVIFGIFVEHRWPDMCYKLRWNISTNFCRFQELRCSTFGFSYRKKHHKKYNDSKWDSGNRRSSTFSLIADFFIGWKMADQANKISLCIFDEWTISVWLPNHKPLEVLVNHRQFIVHFHRWKFSLITAFRLVTWRLHGSFRFESTINNGWNFPIYRFIFRLTWTSIAFNWQNKVLR